MQGFAGGKGSRGEKVSVTDSFFKESVNTGRVANSFLPDSRVKEDLKERKERR